MNERISMMVTYKDGSRKNFNLYDMNTSSIDDCCTTEEELSWYILEGIAGDDAFDDAVSIEADSVITDKGKEVMRLSVKVR